MARQVQSTVHGLGQQGRSRRGRTAIALAATAAAALQLPAHLIAAPSTFDGDAAVGNVGSNVLWADPNSWTTNGVVDTLPANAAPGDDLTFGNGTAGGIIDLGANRFSNSLTFNRNYTLGTAATANTLANATGGIAVNSGTTATINAILTGAGGLTKTDAGTLVLNGINTFTGDINLSGGTLQVAMGNGITGNLGSVANPATTSKQVFITNNAVFRNTTTLNDNTGSATVLQLVFNIGAGGGTLDTPAGTLLTLDDNTAAGNAQNAAQLQGTGTLTKTGAGTLSLGNGASDFATFTGAIVVGQGVLQLGSGLNQFGTAAAGTTVQAGAGINTQGNTTAEPLTLSGTGVGNGGALFNGTAATTGTATGAIALAADASVGGTGNLTLGGIVSGGFNLTKVGAGALLLNGANTYGGNTTVAGGSVRAVFGTGLPSTTNLTLNGGAFEPTASFAGTLGTAAGQVQLPGGASGFSAGAAAITVNLNGGAQLVWGTTPNFNPSTLVINQTTAAGTLDFQNPIDLNGAARTFAGNHATNIGTVSGVISNGTGAFGPTINGAGVIAFSGANTYTGTTTLTAGTLQVATDANLGANGAPIIFDGGTLRVTGTAVTSFANHPATFVANRNIGLDIATAGNTFTVNQALVAGQTLTKGGAGTLLLGGSGTNVLTNLNVNGGILDLGNSILQVNNGGGTTIRTVTGSGTINASGTGSIALTVSDGDAGAANGQTLTINAPITGAFRYENFVVAAGTGVTVLNGANTYSGGTAINSSIVSVSNIGNTGATGNLGTGADIGIASATLRYTGPGETTNRTISLNGTAPVIESNGGTAATPLAFTTNLNVANNAAKTLTLGGTGFGEIAGAIGNNTAATSVTKAGAGTWVLSGTNTYTGTTSVAGGVLSVSSAANLGAATAPLVINGGILRVTGTALTSPGTRPLTVGAGAAGFDVADAANNFTVTQAAAQVTGAFTKAGPGTLTLALPATGNQVNGQLNMNGGTLDIGASALTLNAAGGNTLRGTANSTINATGGGRLIISASTTNTADFGDNSVSPGVTLTINARVSGINGTAGFEYCCDNPGGTIVLNNPANDFAGQVVFNAAGTIAGPSFGPSGSPSSLGSGSMITFNTAGSRLQYTGTGGSTNRGLTFANSAILDASGPSGTIVYTGAVTVGASVKTITLQGSTAGSGEVAGAIPDNTAALITNVTKAGAGTWRLSGANTYTGVTTIEGGVLNVASVADYGVASPIGARGAAQDVGGNVGLLFRGGTLQYTGSTPQATNRQIRLQNNANNAIDASGSLPSATLSFTRTAANADLFENAGTRTLNLTGTNAGLNTFAIPLIDQATNATSVTKSGAGTWVLTGLNTYTGPTTVNAGLLLANTAGPTNSATGTGPVTVNGGTLGGDGRIAGPVTITAVGTLSPGNSPGVLSTGALTMAGGSDLLVELLGTTPGTGHDQVNVTGAVNITGADLVIANVGLLTVGDTFTIINNDLVDAVTGTFASGATVAGPNGSAFSISYVGGTGNDVVLTTTAVPEPASLGVLGLAAAGLLARRRRRTA